MAPELPTTEQVREQLIKQSFVELVMDLEVEIIMESEEPYGTNL